MAAHPLLLSLLLVALMALLPAEAAKGLTKLPSFIRKCSIKDPKIEQCALEHGREALPRLVKGDPSIRLPSLDPLSVTEIHIETGNDASGLVMTCKNIVLKGLANTELLNIKIDQKNSIYEITCRVPHLEIHSDYIVDGKVLLLPVKGSGKANFTFENAIMRYEQKYSVEKRGDLHYLFFPDSSARFNCTKAHFHLENLFNGDEKLGNTVNTFLNENWNAVVDDLGQPFVDASAIVIRQFGLAIVGNVPYEEIFDDVAF